MDAVNSPRDLRGMTYAQLDQLADEIRHFLVEHVSKTGGHLGPNLGVVELTIALHRVFRAPDDVILFDTGHQSYVHKILTGRKDFDQLRQAGGLSGYPSRAESVYDVIENSHATTALSWADGIARSMQLSGSTNRVAAVIGDGALTGGMAWEALNNIAEDPERPIVIVVNDNGRSYAPTVGGFMRRLDPVRALDNVRASRRYEEFLDWGKRALKGAGAPGQFAYDALHGLKRGVKDVLFDAGIFDTLGLKYLGPIDGHDIAQLEEAFAMAKKFGGPVVVHTITEKGRGYSPAEHDEADRFHAVNQIHPETGLPLVPSRFGWTNVFSDEILTQARKDPKIVGITAAMLLPVGLGPMKEEFPDRVFDVGIAEAHAMTMAAGLAYGGYHPVFALYATFMNRAFDQLTMDASLHNAGITVVLDRAGITGSDGASHNGMWDLSIASEIPNMRVAVPRDEETLRAELREALQVQDAPTLLRYPKGSLPQVLPALRVESGYDVLYESPALLGEQEPARGTDPNVPYLLVGLGPMAHTMLQAAKVCPEIPTRVIDPRWVLPIAPEVRELAASSAGVVTLEDGIVDGGVGSELALALRSGGSDVPLRTLGISKHFLEHDERGSLLAQEGMSVDGVVATLRGLVANQSASGQKLRVAPDQSATA